MTIAWKTVENRSSPPHRAPAGLTWEPRWELVNPDSITNFHNLVDSRRVAKRDSPDFVAFMWIYRRCEFVDGMGYMIRVVLFSDGDGRRRYTGISKWPTVPPEDIQKWLAPELKKGIPRTFMGRSPFGESCLTKTVCRHGLTLFRSVDIDGVMFYMQLRANRLTEAERADFPLLLQLVTNTDAFLDPVVRYLATRMNGVTVKKVKRIFMAIANGGTLEAWCERSGVNLKPAVNGSSQGHRLLMDWQGEACRYHELMAFKHPAELEAYQAAGKPRPKVSVTCSQDERAELAVIKALETLAVKHNSIPVCSAEHDGITFFMPRTMTDDLLLQKASSLTILKLAIKPLEDPLKLARQKYPKFAFTLRAKLSTNAFFDSYQLARQCVGNKTSSIANSNHFSSVLASRLQGRVYRTSKADEFEFFSEALIGLLLNSTPESPSSLQIIPF